jgi:hypothetical protein
VDKGHEDTHQLAAATNHKDHQAAGVAQADQGKTEYAFESVSICGWHGMGCKGISRVSIGGHDPMAGCEVCRVSQPQGLHGLRCGARSRDHWRCLVRSSQHLFIAVQYIVLAPPSVGSWPSSPCHYSKVCLGYIRKHDECTLPDLATAVRSMVRVYGTHNSL